MARFLLDKFLSSSSGFERRLFAESPSAEQIRVTKLEIRGVYAGSAFADSAKRVRLTLKKFPIKKMLIFVSALFLCVQLIPKPKCHAFKKVCKRQKKCVRKPFVVCVSV